MLWSKQRLHVTFEHKSVINIVENEFLKSLQHYIYFNKSHHLQEDRRRDEGDIYFLKESTSDTVHKLHKNFWINLLQFLKCNFLKKENGDWILLKFINFPIRKDQIELFFNLKLSPFKCSFGYIYRKALIGHQTYCIVALYYPTISPYFIIFQK